MNFLTCNVAAIRTESGLRSRIGHAHIEAARILTGLGHMGVDGWHERRQLLQDAAECQARLEAGDLDLWDVSHPPERIVRVSGPGFTGRV